MSGAALASVTEAIDARQLAGAVLMVRPAAFGANPETAASNRFQENISADSETGRLAQAEFDALANALAAAGVEVIVLDDTPEPAKPDAVFPNNWFTTHADGTVILYPMMAPSRRAERRADLVETLRVGHGRVVTALVDLSPWEKRALALEGTGSLILDRRRRIAYACRSPRTAAEPLAQWRRLSGYRTHLFDAVDAGGVAIYHTNVMMSLGRGFAALALESVPGEDERRRLRDAMEDGGHEVIELTRGQIGGFGANILHLEGARGPVIAMSEAARGALGRTAVSRLERHGRIVSSPIPTIERYGGGSVRCMLAEIFLPRTG